MGQEIRILLVAFHHPVTDQVHDFAVGHLPRQRRLTSKLTDPRR